MLAKVAYDAEGVKVAGEGDEGAEPNERFPAVFFFKKFSEIEDAGNEKYSDAEEGGGGAIDVEKVAEGPKSDESDENEEHNPLVFLHGAHLIEFCSCELLGVGEMLDFGCRNFVNE